MNSLLPIKHNNLAVILAPKPEYIPELIAGLALLGPVTVLDGGNCFPAYRIAQLIRIKSVHVQSISKHIFVRRAFTCYQILHLLESAPSLAHPHVVLNLLSTFQDDQVTLREANRLLSLCLSQIKRLSLTAPVAVSLEPLLQAEKSVLLQRVCDQADEIFSLGPAKDPQPRQMTFFQGG